MAKKQSNRPETLKDIELWFEDVGDKRAAKKKSAAKKQPVIKGKKPAKGKSRIKSFKDWAAKKLEDLSKQA